MSTRLQETRQRILAAARRLLVERSYHGVGIDQIARAAGVTRQAIYLHHFASKSELLLALVAYVDEVEDIDELLRPIGQARSAREAVALAIPAATELFSRIIDIARVLDAARLEDADAAAAWDDRKKARRENVSRLMRRLKKEGSMKPGWTIAAATDFFDALVSPTTFYLLVKEGGWRKEQYAKRMLEMVRATLFTPDGPS